MLRNLKPAYWLYNLFKPAALKHNLEPYRKLELDKQYFSSVSSADFIGKDPTTLVNAGAVTAVTDTRFYKEAKSASKASINAVFT